MEMYCLLFLTSYLSVMTVMIVSADRCEVITVPLCKDLGSYNMTKFPNSLGHRKQDVAGLEIHQFYPLVKVRCSKDLKEFLCAVYVPGCDPNGLIRTPTRQLCESARRGCGSLMNKFGFHWPESLKCEKFRDDTTTTTTTPETTTTSVNQRIVPCTQDTCQYKMNIKYSPTSITFQSCCQAYTYTKKTLTIPSNVNIRVRNADIRSSSVPVVTWKPVRKGQNQGNNHRYFTLMMVSSDLDSRYIDTDWMVINTPNGHVSTGMTIKEYSGPIPSSATNNMVYFLLYGHFDPVDVISVGKYLKDRRRMDLKSLVRDNNMILVSSTYMLVNQDEYSRYRQVYVYGKSESEVCLKVPGYPKACRNFGPVSVFRK